MTVTLTIEFEMVGIEIPPQFPLPDQLNHNGLSYVLVESKDKTSPPSLTSDFSIAYPIKGRRVYVADSTLPSSHDVSLKG